jgi:signal transduction histidine kinase
MTAKPLRVLHLEDSADDAALVAVALREDGVDAQITRVDSRDAFEGELRRADYDLVLADYNLPSFNGVEAQRLAADRLPNVPFIFVSGSLGEEHAIDRVKAGATDYVLKERLNRLAPAVRRAIAEAVERAERRRAHEANLAKSEFLSRMSHDLRTPLNAILGFAQLLIGEESEANRNEYARQILAGGRHLLELINEVLDIARIESGQLSLSAEPVYVSEVAREVLDLVAPLAAAQRIALTLAPHPCNELPVLADRQRFAQILVNLVSNAVKFNRSGGSVTIRCSERPVKRLRISVIDTGAGIPPEKIQLLFHPFERLGADARGIEGTGLGLALSRGLAGAMKGAMGVESEVDRGSTFWLELPLSDIAPTAATEVAEPVRAGVRRDVVGTILYIEDNQSNVRLMERILGRRPLVKLLHAASGSEGIAMVRAHQPSAVFLDLHLPDMPGEEVLRRLWEDSALRPIPAAVLSADAQAGQMRRLKASGAAAYLVKPLDIGEVLSLVDKLLGQRSETL